jgi:hemerythrin
MQHRYLIKTINELGAAIDKGQDEAAIKEILQATQFYIRWHFGREEDCMERYRCPAAGMNKHAHGVFLERFKVLTAEFESEGASTGLAERIYAELVDWLLNHILKVDSVLASVIPPRSAG